METSNKPVRSRTSEMVIGKTKYIITSHFKENGRETAEEKYVDYIADKVADRLKRPINSGLARV